VVSPVAPTICEQLADYVVGLRYEDIPAAVTTKAKDHLLHLLGNALRSPGWALADGAVRAAAALSGPTGRCTIIGHRERADALDALFANSVLMSKDGLEDAVFPPGVHPGVVTQPVAWAFGEAARASGRELLVAVVAGYDVMTKLCGQVWTWTLDPPRRPNTVVAPFGGAATASRLLGLTPRQTAFAFGHAGQTGMGIVEGSGHMWTISPLLARNGAMAAVMASAGMESSLTVVEGRYGVFETFFRQPVPDDLLVTLGEQFELDGRAERGEVGAFHDDGTDVRVVVHQLASDVGDIPIDGRDIGLEGIADVRHHDGAIVWRSGLNHRDGG
jgi:2-methylcitrate dehydratase PrpD